MASKGFLIVLLIVAVAVAPALATDYVVGDTDGWRLDVNYTNWAKGKEFYVGDRLIFTYNKEYHNVAKVNGSVFQQCSKPDVSNIVSSGNDTIPLIAPGKKWYLCSINDHCTKGMKLVINVMTAGPIQAPAPMAGGWAPAPSPSAAATSFKSFAWVVAAVMASFKLIMA